MEPKTRFLIAKRTTFMRLRQLQTDSIAEFAARLRKKAVECEFKKFKENLLTRLKRTKLNKTDCWNRW